MVGKQGRGHPNRGCSEALRQIAIAPLPRQIAVKLSSPDCMASLVREMRRLRKLWGSPNFPMPDQLAAKSENRINRRRACPLASLDPQRPYFPVPALPKKPVLPDARMFGADNDIGPCQCQCQGYWHCQSPRILSISPLRFNPRSLSPTAGFLPLRAFPPASAIDRRSGPSS